MLWDVVGVLAATFHWSLADIDALEWSDVAKALKQAEKYSGKAPPA